MTHTMSRSWLQRLLPNVLVLSAIAGIACLGHQTDWRFGWSRRGTSPGAGNSSVPITIENRLSADSAESAEWCSADAMAQYRLRFESADAPAKMGIEVSPAWSSEITEAITASGETAFDPTSVAHLTSRASGSAWRVLKRLGQLVKQGDVMALIECVEVGKTKAELQHALVQLRLKRQAYENARVAPVAEQQRREAQAAMRDAEARVLSAEQTLINFGLKLSVESLADWSFEKIARNLQRLGLPAELADLDDESIPGTLLPIVSPIDGTVTQCDLIAGEVVTPSRTLFTIGDARRLVLTLQVSPAEAARVTVGQRVHFRPDGATREVSTQVNWIATAAKERTRTVPVRAELENGDGRLLASSFGVGRIVVRHEPNAVVIPNEAVQSDGDCRLVFVRDSDFLLPDGPKVFYVRTVRTGARDDQKTEIRAGLLAGEVVAANGSAILLNELRRHHNSLAASARRTRNQRVQTSRRPGVDHAFPAN